MRPPTIPLTRVPMADTSIFRPGLLGGQVAIITGGGTGIGFGIAELLAALGAHVVLASRKAEHLEPAVVRLRERELGASAVMVDVRDPERVRRMVEEVYGAHGRIDLLVNNAAGNFYAPSETLSPNAWRAVVEIDLYGTFFCSQAVAPVMRVAGGGRIVNISMTLHYRGWPEMAHATAAKAGVDALTRTLALEWAPHGIRVNAVAPGYVKTEMAPVDRPEFRRHWIEDAPMRRYATPEEIAPSVLYLASDASSFMTGSVLVVDGGYTLF